MSNLDLVNNTLYEIQPEIPYSNTFTEQQQTQIDEILYNQLNIQEDPAKDQPIFEYENYMLELPNNQNIFNLLAEQFSSFIKRFTQKALPSPNNSKTHITNDSIQSFEIKRSIRSVIRSLGDSFVQGLSNISKLNKKTEVKNVATVIGKSNTEPKIESIEDKSIPSIKQNNIVQPKHIQNKQSTFNQNIIISNEGNKIEKAAAKEIKLSKNKNIKTQSLTLPSDKESK